MAKKATRKKTATEAPSQATPTRRSTPLPRRNIKLPSPAKLARSHTARDAVEAAFIEDGVMDSPRLNKLFAPAMIEIGAAKAGTYWLLRGEPVCTGLWLQRSQWSPLWYVDIGACPAGDIPSKLYEFPWNDRRHAEIPPLRGSPIDLLDFDHEGVRREHRLEQIRSFSRELAAEMQSLLNVKRLRKAADRADQLVIPEFRHWLRANAAAED